MRGYLLSEGDTRCPYLPGNTATFEQLVLESVDESDLDALLSQGYRHFGTYFFRPVCRLCHQCVPMRVPLARYVTSRSARRLINRNGRFLVTLERPHPSHEAYRLYQAHKRRFADTPGGTETESYLEYVETFFHEFPFSYQLSIYDADTLIGVSHLDITRTSVSAVYSYYDDRYTRESLGTYAVVRAITMGVERGLDWMYLGYFVAANRHMQYKARFVPNQVLVEEGKWINLLDNGESFIDNRERTGSIEFIPRQRLASASGRE